MIKKTYLMAAVLVTCVASMLVPAARVALALPDVVTMPISLSPAGDDGGCLICVDNPWYCPPDFHDAYEKTQPWEIADRKWGSGPHPISDPCRSTLCDSAHPAGCKYEDRLSNADLERLRSSLEAEDMKDIEAILAAHTDQVVVNVARSAIQVSSNCSHAVIAHLPISSKLANSLAAVTHSPE